MVKDSPQFKIGDLVRKAAGEKPMKVVDVKMGNKDWLVKAQYLSSLHYCETNEYTGEPYRYAHRFRLLVESQPKENEEMAQALYQTKQLPTRFGTFLTRNSKGQIVLEMKGKDGDVQAFDPDALEEVMPYTIAISGVGGGVTNHYVSEEGRFKVGDLLLATDDCYYTVTAVDTKVKGASNTDKKWWKIPAEVMKLQG